MHTDAAATFFADVSPSSLLERCLFCHFTGLMWNQRLDARLNSLASE